MEGLTPQLSFRIVSSLGRVRPTEVRGSFPPWLGTNKRRETPKGRRSHPFFARPYGRVEPSMPCRQAGGVRKCSGPVMKVRDVAKNDFVGSGLRPTQTKGVANTLGWCPRGQVQTSAPSDDAKGSPREAFGLCVIRAGRQGWGARPTGMCEGTRCQGTNSKEEPSSGHANGDGVWDFDAQKASKPPDTHFVLG